jgi:uncharacterized repeat protein (TIGR03803 family)
MSAISLLGQTFDTLYRFGGADGEGPEGTLVQGTDGNFYGTTLEGGGNNIGTLFKITPAGTLTVVHSFCESFYPCPDGAYPHAGVVQAANGDFYGTAQVGGLVDTNFGIVFQITPAGTLTTLFMFDGGDGLAPHAPLVQAADGDFYGTTEASGANNAGGTVFQITPTGTLTTLYSFCSQIGCTDGEMPFAGLLQGPDGVFYGTTYQGGAHNSGTVFKITPAGRLTTLYSFCSHSGCTDGALPYAGLVEDADGNFYGTTYQGGTSNSGTVFKITSTGRLTTLYSFCSQSGCTDGAFPYAGLVYATDGNFYGATYQGGANNSGTLFKITPNRTLTTLYSFCSQSKCVDGEFPYGGLVQGTDGNFYGTTYGGVNCGRSGGCGTIFRLSVGLRPFVKTMPHAGKVGAAISILGTDLSATTSVSFNGTPAVFDVTSATEITTAVPVGATTGIIQVATAAGTLSSGGPFLVMP